MQIGIDYPGVSCIFWCYDDSGRLLVALRNSKSRDEHNTWDVGGGKLEPRETWAECVAREIAEEYGLESDDIQFVTARNVIRRVGPAVPDMVEGPVFSHWIALLFAVHISRPETVECRDPKLDGVEWVNPLALLERSMHSQFWIHAQTMIPYIHSLVASRVRTRG